MTKRTFALVAIMTVATLTLAGCEKANNTPVEQESQIANPASVYCEENGGTLKLEDSAWLCMFEDGSYCEEWAYKNGECKPGDIIYNTVEENTEPTETNYEVDYGTSELYSQEDMDSAIATIMNEFDNEWQVKCEMHKIYYAGDEISQNELWHVQLSSIAPFTQSLVMYSDFHSPVNPEEAGAFDPDQEYTNYNWILWREDGGEWIVVDRWY